MTFQEACQLASNLAFGIKPTPSRSQLQEAYRLGAERHGSEDADLQHALFERDQLLITKPLGSRLQGFLLHLPTKDPIRI